MAFETNNGTAAFTGGRARIELGLEQRATTGLIANLSGYYDGIGADNYEAYGLEFRLDHNF
ncbi:MAG: hypothetical protein KC448_09415 [Yoonia sp.]|nr:hypothetical protein [Yoonia sp.]